MTTPTPELVTAERARGLLDAVDKIVADIQAHADLKGDYDGLEDARRELKAAAPDLARTVIALHEALAAANAKIAELEAGASRSLFALMTDRALAAEARADAAEARVAVMRGLLHAALTTRAMDDLEWQLDARAALETEPTIFGMTVREDPSIPRDEVRFVLPNGKTVTLTNIGPHKDDALETGAGDE